ncbi:hypothetical protein FQA39_LY01955 [Lamprigera yunnana]|nr:hypothetical protein FQA39_LY01955 [Lamprigera yunnana]
MEYSGDINDFVKVDLSLVTCGVPNEYDILQNVHSNNVESERKYELPKFLEGNDEQNAAKRFGISKTAVNNIKKRKAEYLQNFEEDAKNFRLYAGLRGRTYWEQPFSQPYFDNSTRTEITTVGQTANLHCRVRSMGDRAYSWIRKRDLHILTVGILTYSDIPPKVNTEPKISQAYKLSVVVTKTKIVANPELYI